MPFGYMGKVLKVDLSKGKIEEEAIADSLYERYLSGLGIGAWMLMRCIPKDADPLGPDNMLGFVSGLLTGTGSFFTGRWMAVAKSPLTMGFGDANCGGNLSIGIKQCGYDGIFITGKSSNPVYLLVGRKGAEIRDAQDLWGKDTVETEEELVRRHYDRRRPKVACIGPAGEKLSLISGISNDCGRMAARSGLGAVMGSKMLKALVLNGRKRVKVHDPCEMKRLSKKCNRWVMLQPPFLSGPMTANLGRLLRMLPFQMVQDGLLYKIMLRKWGTVSMNQASIEMGDAPVMNWSGSNEDFDVKKSVSVNPDAIISSETVKYHCYACPLGCGGICDISGKTKSEFSLAHKPEYETVMALGSLCMNQDADSIFLMNELLNRAGMDTISAGGTVAFAIESYTRGILTKADTDGLELTWGNSEAIVELVRMMIERKGIGDLLADGVKKAAERIGGDSARYAMHAGGQELGMHDGRNDPGFNLHYSVEPTPGRHTVGSYLYYEMYRLWKKVKGLPSFGFFSKFYSKGKKYVADKDKARMSAACSRYMSVLNGAGCCLFGAFLGADRFFVFEWLNAATGWQRTPEDYLLTGQKILNLRQSFNIREGIKPLDNLVKGRPAGDPPLQRGANRQRSTDVHKMASDFWAEMGWDPQTGVPLYEESLDE